MSMVLLWKVRWLHLIYAAPQHWRLNTNACALLVVCGILLSGIVGALALRVLGVNTEGPLPPFALLVALVLGSLTTIAAFLVFSHFSNTMTTNLPRQQISTPISIEIKIVNQSAILETERLQSMPVSKRPIDSFAKLIALGVYGFLIVWPLVQMTSMFGGAIQFDFTGVRAPTVGHQFLETIREQGNNPVTWGLVFTIVILGPLAEEIIWRGAVQQGLKQIGTPRAGAILMTASMFALFHWGAVPEYGRAAAIPALAVFGVALGVLMERTGRLWSSFIAHALFNCANLFLFSMLPK